MKEIKLKSSQITLNVKTIAYKKKIQLIFQIQTLRI